MGAWQVVGAGGFPGVTVSGAGLIVVDGTACLDGGWEAMGWKCTRHRWRGWWLWGEGAFCRFSSLAGKSALVAAVATVVFGHVGVVDGAVVPKIGVPLRQNAVSVVTIDMWGWTPATPMAHSQAVEAEPLCCSVCTYHVAWTTPSDDNCRWAVDGT
jgi:hypothetical protein